MIYVWDNGKRYSDHAIYFIEAPEDKRVFTLLQAMPGGGVILTADAVTWFKGGAVPLAAFWQTEIDCGSLCLDWGNESETDELRMVIQQAQKLDQHPTGTRSDRWPIMKERPLPSSSPSIGPRRASSRNR